MAKGDPEKDKRFEACLDELESMLNKEWFTNLEVDLIRRFGGLVQASVALLVDYMWIRGKQSNKR